MIVSAPPPLVTDSHAVPAAFFLKNISLVELFVSANILPPKARFVNQTAALTAPVFMITRASNTGFRLRSVFVCPIEPRALEYPAATAVVARRLAQETQAR